MLRKIGGRWFDPALVVAIVPPHETPALDGRGSVPIIGKCVAVMPAAGMTIGLSCSEDEAGNAITQALEAAHAQNIELARAASAKGGA